VESRRSISAIGSSRQFGGLASYRPDSPFSTSEDGRIVVLPLVLEEMSGLSFAEQPPTKQTNQVLSALPTAEHINLYYWYYYATLALHHRQQMNDSASAAWRTWNDALTSALLSTAGKGRI